MRGIEETRKKVCREAKRDAGVATVADGADGHASSFGIDHDSAVLRPAGSFWSDSPSQEQRFLLESLLLAGVSQKFAHLPMRAGVPAGRACGCRDRAHICVSMFAAPLDTDKDPYGFRETGWPPERVPNPSTPAGAKQCGRSVECQHCCKVRGNDACRECSLLCCRHTVVRGSAICDPDGILAPETANKLEELIDAARKDISIPIAAFGLRYAPTLCPPLQIALFRAHARGKHTHSKTEVSNPGGERRAVQIAVLVINKMGVGPGGRRPSSAEFAKQGIACAPKSGPAPPSWPCVERSCS